MYIPSHLEYIIFEILKNSVKAIIDNDFNNTEVNIYIDKGTDDILLKISDKGIGFNRNLNDYIFSYLYTSTKSNNDNMFRDNNIPILSGFAHGLGLSKLYAKYLGGDIKIVSSHGIGTDTYIHIKTIGTDENLP